MTNAIAVYDEKFTPSATEGVVVTPNEKFQLPFFSGVLDPIPAKLQFEIKLRVGNRDKVLRSNQNVLPQELRAAVARLNEISALDVDWDSYGGLPISPAVIERALSLLINTYSSTWFVPELFPTSSGGVALHWSFENRELEVEIRPDLQFETLFVNDETGEEYEPQDPVSLDEVKSLIRRVSNNT